MKKPKQDNEQNGEEGENWNEPEAGADWRKANFGRGEEIQLCICAGWVKITCGWLKEEFLFRELVFYFRQIPIYIFIDTSQPGTCFYYVILMVCACYHSSWSSSSRLLWESSSICIKLCVHRFLGAYFRHYWSL